MLHRGQIYGDGDGDEDFSALYTLDFTGKEDENPWGGSDDLKLDSEANDDPEITNEHLRAIPDSGGNIRSWTVKQSVLDLNGKTAIRLTLSSARDFAGSFLGIGLSADLDPGDWRCSTSTGASMNNGYRFFVADDNGDLRVRLYRDVSNSRTFVGNVWLNGVDFTSNITIEFDVVVGDDDVTFTVRVGEVEDDVVDDNAARHTNFRLAGFSWTCGTSEWAEFQTFTIEDIEA